MLNSAYIKLCIIELCQQMAMQTSQPVVSNAALALGASITIAGILAGLSSAISLSLRIASGHIVSRVAPKKVLIVSSAILAAASLLFALANSVPALAVSRVLYGSGIVVKTVIVVSACVRVVPKNSIGQAVAWLGMANVFAVAVGPNLTQFIGLNFGYGTSFLLSGLLFAAATALCFTFPDVPLAEEEDGEEAGGAVEGAEVAGAAAGAEVASAVAGVVEDDGAAVGAEVVAGAKAADAAASTVTAAAGAEVAAGTEAAAATVPAAVEATGATTVDAPATAPAAAEVAAAPSSPAPPSAKGIARLWDYIYKDSLPLALLGFLEGSIFGIVNTLTLTVSQLRGMPEISLFFVVYVIVAFCERPIVGKLYDRYGFSKVCPTMCAIMGVSMLTFAFTDNVVMVVIDGVLFALGQGSLWPCLQAESVHGIPQEKSGLSTNTLLFGVDLGIMSGPMLGGAILDIAGPMWMYLFATGIGILLTLWTLQYVRIMKRRAARKQGQ